MYKAYGHLIFRKSTNSFRHNEYHLLI